MGGATTVRRVAVVVAALCCLGAPGAAHAAGSPSWFSYNRPATHGTVQSPVDVPMSDGTKLGCGLTLPAGPDGAALAGRHPVLINNNTPYAPAHATRDSYFAPRGYAVITCNPRGTQSSAVATPALAGQTVSFNAAEQRDWRDLVDWAARQPWSTGRVGCTGYSYGGIVCYHAAAQRPRGLLAIAPGAAYADLYREMTYLGGIRGLDVTAWAIGLSSAPGDVEAFRAHPTYDGFWRERSIETKHDQIRASGVPILTFGGWYDIYQDGATRNYRALTSQTWLVMSGGGHLNGADSVPDAGLLAWFDRWLMQRPSAPLPPQKVTSVEKPDVGGRGWQELADWPPPSASTLRLHLTAGAGLGTRPGAAATRGYRVDPSDGQAGYWRLPAPDDPGQDQRVADERRQTYDTGPLKQDVVLAGPIRAHLVAALSATDGNLVARVMDVAPDGTSTLITAGWLKASHRRSHVDPDPVTPGARTSYDVHVWPTNWRLKKGHVLRVSVSSGDVPRIEPDAPAGTVTIAEGTGGSYTDFTVVPDRYDASVASPAPGDPARAIPAPPASRPIVLPSRGCVRGRRITVRVRDPRGRERLRWVRIRVDGRHQRTYRGRALRRALRLRRGVPVDLRRRTGRVRVVAIARTTRGRTIRVVRTYRLCRARPRR